MLLSLIDGGSLWVSQARLAGHYQLAAVTAILLLIVLLHLATLRARPRIQITRTPENH